MGILSHYGSNLIALHEPVTPPDIALEVHDLLCEIASIEQEHDVELVGDRSCILRSYADCAQMTRIGCVYFFSIWKKGIQERYGRGESPVHTCRPAELITDEDVQRGYHYNQKGAKVFLDGMQQPLLDIPAGQTTYQVLSVGFSRAGQSVVPVITIQEPEGPVCYRLPNDYLGWANMLIAMADGGTNFFPTDVTLTQLDGRYYADIL